MPRPNGPLDVALVEVPHGRRALATIAANVFGHPEQKIRLSGVTGTNGKTTTAYLLEQLLRARRPLDGAGRNDRIPHCRRGASAPHTTPESRDLLALLAEGVERGVTEGVMEVSSHALDQGRVWGVPYDVAIFTNLTQDHLDYHGTMEAYFAAKRKLFDGSQAAAPRVAVLNAEDDTESVLAATAHVACSEICTYGIARGDFHARDIAMRPNGMSFTLVSPHGEAAIDVALTGRVNVLNLLAASAAAMARGLSLAQIAEAAPRLHAVPGRFEAVDAGQPFTVVVDYAHTDDALRNVLTLARDLVSPDAIAKKQVASSPSLAVAAIAIAPSGRVWAARRRRRARLLSSLRTTRARRIRAPSSMRYFPAQRDCRQRWKWNRIARRRSHWP